MRVAAGIPVLNNFDGFAELIHSVQGKELTFFVADNWNNNRGVAGSWNMFLDQAVENGIDLLVVCNDDIVWHESSLENLIEAWSFKPEDAIMLTGVAHDVTEGFHVAPDFSSWMGDPKQLLDTVGKFDENIWPGFFEDNDYHYRIKLSGYEGYCYSKARVTHKGSQTQNKNPDAPVVPSVRFEELRSYFVSKWGGTPSNEIWKHPYNDSSKDWKYFR